METMSVISLAIIIGGYFRFFLLPWCECSAGQNAD